MHVVSTAGHVDHGKSTLIERLTGIDPDRLREEKERGLTIDLGFAWLALPGGREIGIVDVPGHERFVHNMLAGVGSVDATIFVVAANEGWRPQSEEHLAILEMLGARAAVVALTKADLVDHETVEAVGAQVAGRLAGTTLRNSQIVAVSGTTGHGLQDLLVAIDRMLDRLGEPADRGRPRLFIDRSFTIHGAGTVVTGTLTGGTLRTDDAVVVMPAGHATRVRGIQSHRRVLDEAAAVRRVALNLAGLERAQLARGDAVVLPGQWEPTTEIDVRLRAVRSLQHALGNRGSFKAYIGSAEVDARLHLYDVAEIAGGDEAFARLSLTNPVVAAPYDRFVLRDTGRRETVGGGTILDAHPPVLRGGAREGRPAQLAARAGASPELIPTLVVSERGVVPRADLARLAGSDAAPEGAISLRTMEVARPLFETLARQIVDAIGAFHGAQPLVRGMPRDDAREAAGVRDKRLFAEIVDAIGDRVVADGPLLRLATHHVVLSLEQEAARDVLLAQLSEARFAPPSFQSLIDAHGAPLVRALLDAGALTKVTDEIVFATGTLDEAKRTIAEAAERGDELTASRIRELLGTSRKYAIPLLEHLDATGFTRRRGDVRELIG